MKIAAAFCLVFLISGCTLFRKGAEPQWQEAEIGNMVWDDLLQITREAFRRSEFKLSDENLIERRFESAWRYQLSPYSREEKREKATLEWIANGDRFSLRVRVQQQKNHDLTKSMNPEEADWRDAPDNVDAAKFLVQFLVIRTRSRF